MNYHVINILILALLLSFFKLLFEDKLLHILLTMEMIVMLSFFSILSLNPEVFSLTSCVVSVMTIMISESVLTLAIFITLLRASTNEKVSSLSLNF